VSSAGNPEPEQEPLSTSGILTSGLSKYPRAGAVSFDIRPWQFKVLVEGDHAMAAVRWPLAMALVAVAASQRSYPPVK
jgi:hypothetical protein